MFSHWLGLLLKKDLRTLNDGNPGASNLWLSAGPLWGLLGILLDFMKGYLPLALLIWSNSLSEYALVPAAIAPAVGHAFSPFMKFKGGKSKAVSFGIWSALTDFEASVVYAVILALLLASVKLLHIGKNRRNADALESVAGMLILGLYLFLRGFSVSIIIIWTLNLLLFIIVNRGSILEAFKDSLTEKTHGRL
jgi:glycerol-3-phosphate acyltransferase PlsY